MHQETIKFKASLDMDLNGDCSLEKVKYLYVKTWKVATV